MLIFSVVAGFLVFGVGVSASTALAALGLRLADRFGGIIFWMGWGCAVVFPAYLGSLALAAATFFAISGVKFP